MLTALSFSRAVVALGLLSLGAACSSASNPSSATDAAATVEDGGGSVGCTGGQAYSANMTQAGASGYTFTLVQATPAPPSEYGNVWTVKVVDASGKSPAAASLSIVPRMPQMGHGSNQVPQVTANADGTFDVKDIYFTMPGLWAVTFSVTQPADAGPATTLDSAAYSFCID